MSAALRAPEQIQQAIPLAVRSGRAVDAVIRDEHQHGFVLEWTPLDRRPYPADKRIDVLQRAVLDRGIIRQMSDMIEFAGKVINVPHRRIGYLLNRFPFELFQDS